MLFVLGCVSWSFAQRTITGTITDNTGEPLIGASVVAEQDPTTGTVTDFDGKYEVNVPDGTTALSVSYTGFATQSVPLGASNVVDVVLSEGVLLGEVVVSATGLERNARDVAYANQTVKSEDLLSAPNKNTLEALRGKVAGVKLSTASGSVGASTRIVLRGEGSLTGNNNALIVVDGIVIDNESSAGGASADEGGASSGFSDYGNRFNDLNPDDIESVTVLKGPSATSLYGSRGASGVLVITTKKGNSGKGNSFKVGLNSTTSFETAYVLLQRQDLFGQGFGLPFASEPSRDSGENWSWGPAFDGVVRPWTSPVDADGDGDLEYLSRPYSAVPNQLENFFRTGRTLNNSVNMSGSNGDLSYYASYSNTDQEGILENTSYKRNTFKVAATAKLSEKLSSNFSVNYSNVQQNTAQEGSRPFEGQNAYANAVQSPVNIPFNELRDYTSPFHDLNGYYGSYTSNPYFILNEFINEGKINNVLGNFSLTYNVMEGLSLTARAGTNIVSRNIVEATPQYAYSDHYVWADGLDISSRAGRANSPGSFSELEGVNTNLDLTGLANYSRNLTEDISLNATAGYNFYQRDTRFTRGSTQGGIVVPGFYNFSNSAQAARAEQNITKYRIIGAYGNVSVGFQNKVFLEYSARNDWSSTLPAENNSFFYQSVGVSSVITDLLEMDSEALNYLKFRGSIGTTGKDAQLYALQSTFVGNPVFQPLANGHDLTFPLNGQAGYTRGNAIGNPDLTPELTTTFELGIDATLFNDLIDIAYTYYNSNHTEQLVEVQLPRSSGFTTTVRNLGEIQNSGHELSLTLRPLKNVLRDVNWDLNLLYATNDNEVIEILDPAIPDEELSLGTFQGVNVVAREGLPYGTFRGPVVLTDPNGNIVVDETGLPRLTSTAETLGSYQPDWTGSVGSTVEYKGLQFNILFDIRQGGKFLSYTQDLTEFNGTALTTVVDGQREPFVVPGSVVEQADGTYIPNTVETNLYDFLRIQPGAGRLVDASFVKLRELGLRYNVPSSVTGKTPFSSLTVGLFAKNVKFWLPEENTFADPEVNGPALTGNAQGIETTQTPPSRSFGVNVSVQF